MMAKGGRTVTCSSAVTLARRTGGASSADAAVDVAAGVSYMSLNLIK